MSLTTAAPVSQAAASPPAPPIEALRDQRARLDVRLGRLERLLLVLRIERELRADQPREELPSLLRRQAE